MLESSRSLVHAGARGEGNAEPFKLFDGHVYPQKLERSTFPFKNDVRRLILPDGGDHLFGHGKYGIQAVQMDGNNVLDVKHQSDAIYDAVLSQVDHGPYPQQALFGSGNSGQKIADLLATKAVSIQKYITY